MENLNEGEQFYYGPVLSAVTGPIQGIQRIDTPQYWKWTSLPESRFPEVAELIHVWWLDIRGKIGAGMLSPRTSYTAYLVYKLEDEYGFVYRPSEVPVGISGVEVDARLAFLVPEGRPQRCDRFEEVETRESDDDYEVFTPLSDVDMEDASSVMQSDIHDCIEMSMKEVKDCVSHKEGLIVEGIEIRPRIG
ncbi:F-box protein At2g02240-like [Solanum pennellii]|uniref:F-box protein At2g02240-like n=1 Tax=Solanum pennellii TaxID=28526 RepID=A0ABM1V1Y1_SOLPN|nr:F-box protein At2g02240-like [Solanum pennellii]